MDETYHGTGLGSVTTSPRRRHPENFADSMTLIDFARRSALSLKSLHEIRNFDLVLDRHFSDRHLHNTEPFVDTFRQALRDGLEQ